MRAIAAEKSVVTANMAVIACYGQEITAAAAARGVDVLIGASVCGGIPIIEPLKQSLGANRIQRVSGIINGTTNYLLSRMADEGAAYATVLADAQRLGYAEADPAADVGGRWRRQQNRDPGQLGLRWRGAPCRHRHGGHRPVRRPRYRLRGLAGFRG